MLRFQSLFIPTEVEENKLDTNGLLIGLKGLPDFAYDKHTRVGKAVCVRMTGIACLKDLVENQTEKVELIGWALFFAEGGIICGGIESTKLSELEHKFIARKFSVSVELWKELIVRVRGCVESGIVNKMRESVLVKQ